MHKSHKARATPHPKETQSWIKKIPTIWRALIFLVGLPGLYVGILSALPRISVSPSEELRKYDPLSAPFVISNDGFLAIHSVNMPCRIDHYLGSPRRMMSNVTLGDNLVDDEIGPDGRSTHFCNAIVQDSAIKELIVTTTVLFRPDFLPWTTSRNFHFKGHKSDDGIMRWSPYTPNKNWF
jgi:hypothetical protein